MKRLILFGVCGFVVGLLLARTQPGHGMEPFFNAFVAKYVKQPPSTPEETAFAQAVTSGRCNVCHEGLDRKNRNAYGKAVNKYLHKTDIKNAKKIDESLAKVFKQKTDPKKADSPTFGDLITEGKLPGSKAK